MDVIVNGNSQGSFTLAAMGTVETHTISGVNETGAIVIRFESAGSRQIVLDDVSWTAASAALPIHTATTDVCTIADGPITTTMNNAWMPITHNGELLAEINDMGGDMGTVNADFYISTTAREDASGTNYLDRTLFITPTNNIAAMVRIYLTDAELQALITASAGDSDAVTAITDLIITKVDGVSCSATFGGSGGTVITPTSMAYGSDHYLEFSVTGFSAFSASGGAVALPVEFTSFTGELKNTYVNLSWSTASESNSDYFGVEQSRDGANWTTLGTVAAAGNSTTAQHYTFSDGQPTKGNNFYRLKQVDLDGVFKYSDVIRIVMGSKFEVIHQDLNGGLRFEVFTPASGRMTYEMYSMDGRLVANGTEQVGNGVNNVKVEAASLQSGLYVIRFTNGNESISHKFFKR